MLLVKVSEFLLIYEFRYGQTWPSPFSLSLYNTFKCFCNTRSSDVPKSFKNPEYNHIRSHHDTYLLNIVASKRFFKCFSALLRFSPHPQIWEHMEKDDRFISKRKLFCWTYKYSIIYWKIIFTLFMWLSIYKYGKIQK